MKVFKSLFSHKAMIIACCLGFVISLGQYLVGIDNSDFADYPFPLSHQGSLIMVLIYPVILGGYLFVYHAKKRQEEAKMNRIQRRN